MLILDRTELYAYLELIQGEALARTDTGVVLDGRAADDGPEVTADGTRGDLTGLVHTVVVTPLLAHRLVEPGAHHALPILVEMAIWHDVVTFRGHFTAAMKIRRY